MLRGRWQLPLLQQQLPSKFFERSCRSYLFTAHRARRHIKYASSSRRWWAFTWKGSWRPAAAATWSAGSARWWTHSALERRIGRAAKESRDERERAGHNVVIRAVGKFRRHSITAIAFVEVAAAFDEFVVLYERAVVLSTRPIVAFRAIAFFEVVAGAKLLYW